MIQILVEKAFGPGEVESLFCRIGNSSEFPVMIEGVGELKSACGLCSEFRLDPRTGACFPVRSFCRLKLILSKKIHIDINIIYI